MGAKYLITGGAGFIGSHLVDALLARGDEVVVLDDFSTGSRANLGNAISSESFTLHRGSAANAAVVDALTAECDLVLHFAAAVGVDLVFRETAASIETNLLTTRTVLQSADRTDTPVVVASSSEVYGKNQSLPLAEDDDLALGPPTSPRWSYAAAKAMGEWLALSLARERGLRVQCLRLFNTVGPRQSGAYGMVLPKFVRQALGGDPITVYGDGMQTRCFAHVADVVDAVLRLTATPVAWGQVVNVGSDVEVSIGELAESVRACCESDSSVVCVPREDLYDNLFEEPLRRVPDLRRLRELTGSAPQASIERVVASVVDAQRREQLRVT